MADVELIIKMPEEVYKSIINGKNYVSYQAYVEEAIKNGTSLTDMLEQIRAEIQSLRNCLCNCSDGIIDDVEDILDKYKVERNNEE